MDSFALLEIITEALKRFKLMCQGQNWLMPIDAKRLRMLLSVPVLTVKAQEWEAMVPPGDQGVSQGASAITWALGGCCFMR